MITYGVLETKHSSSTICSLSKQLKNIKLQNITASKPV